MFWKTSNHGDMAVNKNMELVLQKMLWRFTKTNKDSSIFGVSHLKSSMVGTIKYPIESIVSFRRMHHMPIIDLSLMENISNWKRIQIITSGWKVTIKLKCNLSRKIVIEFYNLISNKSLLMKPKIMEKMYKKTLFPYQMF